MNAYELRKLNRLVWRARRRLVDRGLLCDCKECCPHGVTGYNHRDPEFPNVRGYPYTPAFDAFVGIRFSESRLDPETGAKVITLTFPTTVVELAELSE